MKFNCSVVIILASLGLLALTGCAGGESQTATETESSPVAESPVAESSATPATTAAEAESTDHGGQGGQVVESGDYHLELVTAKEADGVHLDLFLQKGDSHEAISDAKVTAQVQLSDGSQQALDMEYDASGQHYTAFLPGAASGEYNVAILSDISGEKVNGRFTFSD